MAATRTGNPAVLSGATFIALGGGFLAVASRHDYGSAAAMGPGFLAIWASGLLLALGVVQLVVGLVNGGGSAMGRPRLRGLGAVALAMIAFAAIIRPFGALPAGLLSVAVMGSLMGGVPKWRLAAFGLLTVLGTLAVFTFGLRVRLMLLPGLYLPL